MSKITTEDCKQFLLSKYPDLNSKDWKRVRKYKDNNSNWCRDFEHKSGEITTLIEINNELQQSEIANTFQKVDKPITIKDPTKVVNYKRFSPELVKAAKKIVKKATDYDEDETFQVSPEMKGYEAIPNCFVFFFVGEGNTPDTKITKDVYFEMNTAIFFSPITTDCYDQHLEHILGDFLPSSFNEECECQFTPYFEDDKDALTIREIIEQLSAMGFIYERKSCDLKEEFADYTFIPQEIEVDVKKEELEKKIIDALNKDDDQIIEEVIKSGEMDVNYNVKAVNILNYCYKNDKFKCFNVLLKNISNLCKYNEGKKHIFELLTYERIERDNVEKYLNAIINNANMNFINNNQYASLIFLLINQLTYSNSKGLEINELKKQLESIKRFFDPEQYREVILYLALSYEIVENDPELLNIALDFIDDNKQNALTDNVLTKMVMGNDPLSEVFVDKLIKYNLNIRDVNIKDFIIAKCEEYRRIVNRKSNGFKMYYFDNKGNQLPEDTSDKDSLIYWEKQLLKFK